MAVIEGLAVASMKGGRRSADEDSVGDHLLQARSRLEHSLKSLRSRHVLTLSDLIILVHIIYPVPRCTGGRAFDAGCGGHS